MTTEATGVKENVETKQENLKKQVQSAEFGEVASSGTSGPGGSIDILLEMNVPITVVIGRMEIPIRQLLQLRQGSVLKLEKPIDEPVDLYINESRFATGSVVVVDGCFAVKVKQIINVEDSVVKSDKV
jgi:flagellar motor switch protein FliN/FliY